MRQSLDGLGLPKRGETLVSALSGGADSVALLDGLVSLGQLRGFRVVAAHLDHRLRPESGEDVAFCRALCERLGTACVIGEADVAGRAEREGGGLEQAARSERHSFLRRVKAELGAVAIALGHTEDDQAETLLLRLVRGAGAAGLAAMRVFSKDLVRPLLSVSRAAVTAHLEARGLTFREDPSNRDLRFARNRVRHELIPYLERHFNPRLRQTLARSASLFAAESELIGSMSPTPAVRDDGSVELPLAQLRALDLAVRRALVRRALEAAGGMRGVSEVHVSLILKLGDAERASGRAVSLPGARVASVVFETLRIAARRPAARPFALPLNVPGRVVLPGGLALVAEEGALRREPALDPAVTLGTSEPLLVRTRRPGDRVRVGGRSRSLKRYLIERRVPARERAGLPLVAAGSDVLWLPGQPLLDDAYGLRVRLEPA